MNGQTDDGQQAIRKAHMSFQLMYAKNRMLTKYVLNFYIKLLKM